MTDLDGRTIVVTGASRGLGRSMATRFAAEGARVVLVARDAEALDEVARSAGGETLVAPGDVRRETDVKDVIEETLDTFGAIDVLLNNAGIGLMSMYGHGKDTASITTDEWDSIVDVNLKGAFLFTRDVLPTLLEQGHGNVLNVTSTFATEPKSGWAPYVSSKFGLLGLTKTTALEYEERGINVNSLHPGGKAATAFWDHLPEERDDVLGPEVMNDAAVMLAAQGPAGVTGEHHDAAGWERRLR